MITSYHNHKLVAHKEVLIAIDKIILIINEKLKCDLHPMAKENLRGQRKAYKMTRQILIKKISVITRKSLE